MAQLTGNTKKSASDFNMYKRFFAFGCSFTEYRWSTWADIIAYSYPNAEYYNFGKAGGSNQIIFSRLMEADEQYGFNKDDLIIVQWTGVNRESRWKDGYWGGGGGNIYQFNTQYPKEFVENWTHPTDYLIKDLAAIKAVNAVLKASQCTYFNICMVSINNIDFFNKKNIEQSSLQAIINGYKTIYKDIRPSFSEIVFESKNWAAKVPRPLSMRYDFSTLERKEVLRMDVHPTPKEHLEYVKKVLPEITLAPDVDIIAEKETEIILPGPNREPDAPLTSLFGNRSDPKRPRDSFFFYKRLKDVPPENIAPNIH